MGWRTVADVRDYSQAKGAAYVVHLMLAERAPDETRIARPGVKLLARDSRVSKATAQRALKTLEGLGEIEAVAHREGGRGMATEWRILTCPPEGSQDATLPERVALTQERVASEAERVASAPERVAPVRPQPERTEEESKGTEQVLFEQWRTGAGMAGARLTPARLKKLQTRLSEPPTEGPTRADDLRRAIAFVTGSRWHRENGHLELTMILRSAEQVDKYLQRAKADEGGAAASSTMGQYDQAIQ